MAAIKRKTRKKLSKQLAKLVRRHGAETALALVSGIVSTLAAETTRKAHKKRKAAPARGVKKRASANASHSVRRRSL
jgi:hypothetical protein